MGGARTRSSTCVGGAHLGPDRRLARLVLERYREALTGDVRMNCDLCTYRVRLPGYEDKVGTPISLTPHGDGPARGRAPRAPGDARARAPRSSSRRAGRPAARAASCAGPTARRPRSSSTGSRYAYPDGSAALAGVDLTRRAGRARRRPRPQRRGQDDARARSCGALEDLDGRGRASAAIGSAARRAARCAARVGIVFQDPDDQLFMPTVEADVAFGPANQGLRGRGAARARGARRSTRVRHATSWPRRAPHSLSAGERRRAAIAGVLACRPDVLVLDEPTAALDPAARRELLDVLRVAAPDARCSSPTTCPTRSSCARARSCSTAARSSPTAPTREVLADEGFMRAHRLELPAGFNPLARMTGTLRIVGLGPGGPEHRTAAAAARGARAPTSSSATGPTSTQCADLLRPGQEVVRGRDGRGGARAPTRRSRARPRGARVALVSSGDAGVYGMAARTLARAAELPEAERPAVEVVPGVTAALAARRAARRAAGRRLGDALAVGPAPSRGRRSSGA